MSPKYRRTRAGALCLLDARGFGDCPTWQEKLQRVHEYMDAMSERPNLLVIDTLGFWAGCQTSTTTQLCHGNSSRFLTSPRPQASLSC